MNSNGTLNMSLIDNNEAIWGWGVVVDKLSLLCDGLALELSSTDAWHKRFTGLSNAESAGRLRESSVSMVDQSEKELEGCNGVWFGTNKLTSFVLFFAEFRCFLCQK